MKEIVLATRNPHKVREIKNLLLAAPVKLLTLRDFPEVPDVAEDGRTLKANALKKALAAARATKRVSLSDDTGLFVDALKGAPGVRSARFAGENVSYEANNQKLLRLLRGIPLSRRGATFLCVAALAHPSGRVRFFEGKLRGIIAEKERGRGGFGYDPLFYVPAREKRLAQMPLSEKNKISHRARAFRKLAQALLRP